MPEPVALNAATAHKIEPGTLIVLVDVPDDDHTLNDLAAALEHACGHSRFVLLRVASSEPVTVTPISELLAALQ